MAISKRVRKPEPWYHVSNPRCDAITLAETKCKFTATHQSRRKLRRVFLCLTHAQMADFPVMLIPVKTIEIGDE